MTRAFVGISPTPAHRNAVIVEAGLPAQWRPKLGCVFGRLAVKFIGAILIQQKRIKAEYDGTGSERQ